MIRSSAILLLILISVLAAIPTFPRAQATVQGTFINKRSGSATDPNATLTAFNYTYAQADLYTKSSPGLIITPTPNSTAYPFNFTEFTWLNTVPRTIDGSRVTGSGFHYNLTKSNLPISNATRFQQVVSWNLTIPKHNCIDCTNTKVAFNLNGTLTKGTNANYTVFLPTNRTIIQSQNFTTLGSFGPPTISLSGCPARFCVDVTKYTGYNLTIAFRFGWNSSETGMRVEEGKLSVSAMDNTYKQSSSNYMTQGTDPTKVIHNAAFPNITYNNTVRYLNGPKTLNVTHTWSMEVLSVYYPNGYNLTQALLNQTSIPRPNGIPFEQDSCNPADTRCASSLIAFNLTDFTTPKTYLYNSTITIISETSNSISQLTSLAGGGQANSFSSGDPISVRTIISTSVANATLAQRTGNLTINFFDHTRAKRVITGQTMPISTSTGGIYNFTLPVDCSNNSCGIWTINATFTSSLDLGAKSTTFRMDQMQVKSFKSNGSNTGLNVQGTLTYSNNSPAPSADGIIFAIDSGTPTSIPVAPTTNTSSSGGLYVANATLVNGVFTQGQSLIMIFTIANNGAGSYNATVTIQHEWPGSQIHGVNVTFYLGVNDGLGDGPFTSTPQSFQAAFSLTPNGIHLVLTSLKTQNPETLQMSIGNSPVVPTQQHAGLFKIIVQTKGTTISNSLESPPYAYVYGASVLGLPLTPSRYLAYSTTFTTNTTGGFSFQMRSDSILAARKLVVFALARDSSGIVLVNSGNSPGFSDSTTLQSSMDAIGQVSEGQSLTGTLHLTSNSTTLTQVITVNLNIQGEGAVATSSSITIGPGAVQTVTLPFKAPTTPGQYILTFSSPQYGGGIPLASQTLQVTILQSNLQILIPAAIGVVVAIIVLGFYLVRRSPQQNIDEEKRPKATSGKTKPPSTGSPPSKSLTRTERGIR